MLRHLLIPLALLVGVCPIEYKWEHWKPKTIRSLDELYMKYSDLKPVSERNLCKSVRHSSEAEYFCCGGSMYKSGINFNYDFTTCFRPPKNPASEETINETMWRFYECQVTSRLHNPEHTVADLAKSMVEHMTADNKQKVEILSRVAEADEKISSANIDQSRLMSAVRYAYHATEQDVCENRTSTLELDSDFDTCTDRMDYYRENIHSRGDCCKGYAIPVRLEYLRRAPTLAVRRCTKSLMYQIPEKPIFYMDYDFEESDAQQMCMTACALVQLKLVQEENIRPEMLWNANKDAEFWYSPFNFDFKTVSDKLIGLFSKGVQQQFRDVFNETVAYYEHPENYTINMREETYDLVGHIQESEFWENVTRGEIEPTILNCQGYNDVVQQIEMALYKFCSDEPATEMNT